MNNFKKLVYTSKNFKVAKIVILEGSPDFKGFKKSGNTQFRSLFTLLKASKVAKIAILEDS